MRKGISSRLAQLAALLGIALWLPVSPANAYCPYQCSGNYSNSCVAMCGADRRSPEEIARDRKAEAERQKRTREVLAEFSARRDALHAVDPSSPQFKAVFEAYKQARRKRDGDLLGGYAAGADQNLLAVMLTGGTVLQVLDEPYMLPPHSRKAFHDFASSQLNRVLTGGSILSVIGGDGSVISSEEGSAIGSYGRYASLADKEELDVWKSRHGVATDPFPPEPVSPQEAERKRAQTAEIQAAHDHMEASKAYGHCLTENGLTLRVRHTVAEMRSAEAACVALKPPPRSRSR